MSMDNALTIEADRQVLRIFEVCVYVLLKDIELIPEVVVDCRDGQAKSLCNAIAISVRILVVKIKLEGRLSEVFVATLGVMKDRHLFCGIQLIAYLLDEVIMNSYWLGYFNYTCLIGEFNSQVNPRLFEAMHLTATLGNHALVAFDHRGNLLALIRMDQEYDLVMPHVCSL